MDTTSFLTYGTETVRIVLLASMPPVLAAAITGVLISLIQALTQVQEQTLPFAFKLIAVVVALLIVFEGFGAELLQFSTVLFDNIARV